MSEAPLLMTPGPTRIPERVLRAAHRVLHHRTPDFSAALAEALERLRPLFGALVPPEAGGAHVLPVHATGRAAMEGAVVNFLAPGDTIVSCCNGKFGEMWAGLAESYGVRVERVCTDWSTSADPDEVAAALDRAPETRAVTVVHSDSSTGALNPVEAVAAVARERGARVFVDGISAVGGVPFEFDAWGLDFAVTSSQKCLMSSPGLSFAVVGPRVWGMAQRSGFPTSYLSFEAIRESLSGPRPETPGTTPVGLVLQVLDATRMIGEEGLAAVHARHQAMAEQVRARALAAGCTLYGAGIVRRSPTLTALVLPAGSEAAGVRAAMLERGVLIAGGLGRAAEGCVRIGHMGDIRLDDVARTMDGFEAALARRGA